MTSLRSAWGDRMSAPRAPEQPAIVPAPNQHNLAHNPPSVAHISRSYDEAMMQQGPSKLEVFMQDSMSSMHRDIESLKDEIRRRDDKDSKFDKLERLIKHAGLAIMALMLILAAFTWFRAENYVKSMSNHINRLAASRLTVDQLINLVSQ